MTIKNETLVAVYGSLKSRQSNNRLLSGSESTLIGSGLTSPNYDLLDFKAYPGAIPGNKKLRVEVWSVNDDTLSLLDRLESHPHFYNRSEVVIQLDNCKLVTAWMYVLTNPEKYSNPTIKDVYGTIDWSY